MNSIQSNINNINYDNDDDDIDHYGEMMNTLKFDLNQNLAQIIAGNVRKFSNDSIVSNFIMNKDYDLNNVITINYRLIHHLYVYHKTNVSCNDPTFWTIIANDYNLVLSTNYSSNEIENFWNKMSTMEKRKIDLQFYINNTNNNNNNQDNLSNNDKNDKENIQSENESEKIQSSKNSKKNFKNNNDNNDIMIKNKKKKISIKKSTNDKSCQTSPNKQQLINDKMLELMELSKEEYHLKIELYKLRLEQMKKQSQKNQSIIIQ